MRYILKIELISDMCPSSGEVYNSKVDTEIDYDAYGMPYLSAKRLRGCLRESALFLRDWGKEIPVEQLFGREGSQRGNFTLSSARLPDYEENREQLLKCESAQLSHPQNVLGYYTYLRTQTAMENGVAKETSLRQQRVLRKGLVFEAELIMKECYEEMMQDICGATRHMGLNRTRGMGEVKITLCRGTELSAVPEGYLKLSGLKLEDTAAYRLNYRIRLQEPLILKSTDRGQENTQNYIEGSRLLGILAERIGKDAYRQLTSEPGFFCANLYVTDSKERYVPAPVSLCRKKDDTGNQVFDLAAGYKTADQIKNLGGSYTYVENGAIRILTPGTQIRYHHSRPEDKSIGRALGGGEGELYYLSSLTEGQVFAGFIEGNGKQMKQVLKAFAAMRYFRMGYGRTSEYGKVELLLDSLEMQSTEKGFISPEITVTLHAPIILYNEEGMASPEPWLVAQALSSLLGKNLEINEEHMYLRYTMLGGWQSMWQKPKQTQRALGAGTVLRMRPADGTDIEIKEALLFAGERTAEGYGELALAPVSQEQVLHIQESPAKEVLPEVGAKASVQEENVLLKELRSMQRRKEIKARGRKDAAELLSRSAKQYRPAVNRLLLVLKEQSTETGFWDACDDTKDSRKKEFTEKLKKLRAQLPDYEGIGAQEQFECYVKAVLTEAKYIIRAEEGGEIHA